MEQSNELKVLATADSLARLSLKSEFESSTRLSLKVK